MARFDEVASDYCTTAVIIFWSAAILLLIIVALLLRTLGTTGVLKSSSVMVLRKFVYLRRLFAILVSTTMLTAQIFLQAQLIPIIKLTMIGVWKIRALRERIISCVVLRLSSIISKYIVSAVVLNTSRFIEV